VVYAARLENELPAEPFFSPPKAKKQARESIGQT
jgi:hypothetical protein